MGADANKYFIIYGPPGSGKTTVAQEVCKRIGVSYLSVGEITRREIATLSDLGLELKSCLDRVVEYTPELITRVMKPYILSARLSGFMLDGYPKYPNEVSPFISVLEEGNMQISGVLILSLSLREAMERVSNRKVCLGCGKQFSSTIRVCSSCKGILVRREDDQPAIFSRRFRDHASTISQTTSFIRKYVSPEHVFAIDASLTTDKVLDQVYGVIDLACLGSSAERAHV